MTADQLAGLARLFGERRVLTDAGALERYGRDETEDLWFAPGAVVLPESVDEVAALLRFAAAERLPVTPRGAGTGLSGGALPVHGGVVLSLERMSRIRGLDPRNLTAEAEAG